MAWVFSAIVCGFVLAMLALFLAHAISVSDRRTGPQPALPEERPAFPDLLLPG